MGKRVLVWAAGRWGSGGVRRRTGVGVAGGVTGVGRLFAGAEQGGSIAAFIVGGCGNGIRVRRLLGGGAVRRSFERAVEVTHFILGANEFFSGYFHLFDADDLVVDEADELDILRWSTVDPLLVILAVLDSRRRRGGRPMA